MTQRDGARLSEIVAEMIESGVSIHAAELAGIVSRMPRTRDGVPVMAGDMVQRNDRHMHRRCLLKVGYAFIGEFQAPKPIDPAAGATTDGA